MADPRLTHERRAYKENLQSDQRAAQARFADKHGIYDLDDISPKDKRRINHKVYEDRRYKAYRALLRRLRKSSR